MRNEILSLFFQMFNSDLGSQIGARVLEECEDDQDLEKVKQFCEWFLEWFYNRELNDSEPYAIQVILKSLYRDNQPILDELDLLRRLGSHSTEVGEPHHFNYYSDQEDMVVQYISPRAHYNYNQVLEDLFEILELEKPSGDPEEYIPEMYKNGLIPLDTVEELIGYTGTVYRAGDDKDAERAVIWNVDGVYPDFIPDHIYWVMQPFIIN